MKSTIQVTPKIIVGLLTLIFMGVLLPARANEENINNIKPLIVPLGTAADLQGVEEQQFSGEIGGIGGEDANVSDDSLMEEPYHLNNPDSFLLPTLQKSEVEQKERQSLSFPFADF
jgi:hypothetical protein